jgi:hypothetical protein
MNISNIKYLASTGSLLTSKNLIILLKIVVFVGFLYLWNYWSVLTLFFSDDNTVSITDYLFGLSFNFGLLLSILPYHRYNMYISFLPISFTSYIYISTLANGSKWTDDAIGLAINSIAIFLLWHNYKKKRERNFDRKS